MKAAELVKQLRALLDEATPYLDELDHAKAKVADAKAELTATKEQITRANTDLEKAKKVAKDSMDADSAKHALAMDGYARQIAEIQEKIEAARKTLAENETALAAQRTEHEQIAASFAALRKRLV